MTRSIHFLFLMLFCILLAGGCAATLPEYHDPDPRYLTEVQEWSVINGLSMDHALRRRFFLLTLKT